MKSFRPLRYLSIAVFAMLLPCYKPALAYSLLTHEQMIDLTWKDSIVPLLLSRYPTLTPAQLEHARAYAYGGCVIQDIGYYPFGDRGFSNLTHYVRTGDFVVSLFRNAGSADELAFAVGALSHYIGDSVGHSEATNLAVPYEFPKLFREYGSVVNYSQGERQHVQTEFAFDIDEVAHGHMAPLDYLKHVGLQVPTRQLAIAFYQTYGITEDFSSGRGRRINVGGYRFAVRTFIPRIAYAVTLLHQRHEPVPTPTPELAKLEKEIAIVSADSHWDLYRRKPGIGTYSLAGLLFVLPKVGAIKLVSVKGPSAETETMYIHSLMTSATALRLLLVRFTVPATARPSLSLAATSVTPSDPPANEPLSGDPGARPDVPRPLRDPRHPISNRDLDTGRVVKAGEYSLTDATYADLVHRIASLPTQPIPPAIKENILKYYADPNAPISTKKNAKRWAQLQADLVILKAIPVSSEPLPYATYGADLAGDEMR